MNQHADNTPLARVANLHKHYRLGSEDLHVLRGVSLDVKRGQWIGVFGRSGSGKSTLLHLVGGLDTPDAGEVWFDGVDLYGMAAGQRDRFRNRRVGFVFQQYHLLPELNVLDNVLIASMVNRQLAGGPAGGARAQARELLGRLGLGERLKHRPNQLSGGERQRVAIARALVNQPDVLLADEPTGNLDRITGQQIMSLLSELHAAGQTIIMVSHDPVTAQRADLTLTLEQGRLRTGAETS